MLVASETSTITASAYSFTAVSLSFFLDPYPQESRKNRFSMLSVAAGVQLSANAARAAEVCDTVDACWALQAKVEARLAVLLKNIAPNLTDIVRNADGSVRHMNQYDADSYCRNQGQRLPTARELALYSQSLGAQGISETKKDGYYLVKGSDSAGIPDNFYFSSKGYQRPSGDLGSFWFWSSSVHPDFSDNAYVLYGDNGGIDGDRGGFDINAVRCVRSR